MKLDSFAKKIDDKFYTRRVFEIEVLTPDSKTAMASTQAFLALMSIFEDDLKQDNPLNRLQIKENSVHGGMSVVQRRISGKLQPIRK